MITHQGEDLDSLYYCRDPTYEQYLVRAWTELCCSTVANHCSYYYRLPIFAPNARALPDSYSWLLRRYSGCTRSKDSTTAPPTSDGSVSRCVLGPRRISQGIPHRSCRLLARLPCRSCTIHSHAHGGDGCLHHWEGSETIHSTSPTFTMIFEVVRCVLAFMWFKLFYCFCISFL